MKIQNHFPFSYHITKHSTNSNWLPWQKKLIVRYDDNEDGWCHNAILPNQDLFNIRKIETDDDYTIGLFKANRSPKMRTARYGLFEFRIIPFGLTNASGTFHRLMARILRHIPRWTRLCSLPLSKNSWRTCRRLKQAGLKLNPEKCEAWIRIL